MVELSQVRIVCNDTDKKGIHVKSTLDNTYKLDSHTDESISWTDADLIAIKNCLERPCEILFEAIRLPQGRRAIFKPARQSTYVMLSQEVSSTRCDYALTLGPGETCMLRTDRWTPQGGIGARFPV